MVLIKREIDDKEFWSSIFGACPESFGDWMRIEFLGKSDWDTPGIVRLTDLEDEYPEHVKLIDLSDLVEAYNALWAKVDEPGTGGVHQDYLDLENLDCIGADAILQQALYGSVIFG
jgi:hypothetical protein